MVDVSEVLRLRDEEGLGGRRIARALGVTYGKVRTVLEQNPPPVPPDVSPLRLVVWDIETTNLRADIGRLVLASFLDAHTGKLETMDYTEGGEAALAAWVRDQVERADMLIGHNTKAFDRNFLNGVLARHGLQPLPKRQHLDTYLIARYGLKGLLQSNSMDNLADFFQLDRSKYKPSKHDWRDVLVDPESLEEIRIRCEEDVLLNLELWYALRPYWHAWKGD